MDHRFLIGGATNPTVGGVGANPILKNPMKLKKVWSVRGHWRIRRALGTCALLV